MTGTNFIHVHAPPDLVEAFLGPILPGERCVTIDDTWDMARVAVEAGLMPSRSQARKQGFVGPVPYGYTQHISKRHPSKSFWIVGREVVVFRIQDLCCDACKAPGVIRIVHDGNEELGRGQDTCSECGWWDDVAWQGTGEGWERLTDG